MPVMSTAPVFLCRRCGAPVVFTYFETYNDPEGKIFFDLMSKLKSEALCDFHREQREFYANQNRLADWESGNL
jgi:hypothetical protein